MPSMVLGFGSSGNEKGACPARRASAATIEEADIMHAMVHAKPLPDCLPSFAIRLFG